MEIGQLVGGRYLVEALAGRGGMGIVYRATDRDGNPVAIKVLPEALIELGERFTREARVLLELQHPAIVQLVESGTTPDGERFLVMEWLDGVDLGSYLRQHRLALGETLALIGRIAGALGAAHERLIVHRDVKPNNIFLPQGDLRRAKLLDFGVAHWSSATQLTATGMRLGTPSYMAPEQIRGLRVDARADVFSLGCVFYRCLCGQTAYRGEYHSAVFYKILMAEHRSIASIVRGVPAPVVELLEAMMATDANTRPRNGKDVAARIAKLQTELMTGTERHELVPIEATPSTITEVEQRLVSVVTVAASQILAAAWMPKSPNQPGTVTEIASYALAARSQPPDSASQADSEAASRDALTELRQRYESLGVRFDRLGDGAMIAVVDTRSAATDLADRAAQLALQLRDAISRQTIAVTTGRAVFGHKRVRGEVVDRAVELLATGQRVGSGAIRVCDTTADLLESSFEIERDHAGAILVDACVSSGYFRLLGEDTPFVGRVREMALLAATLQECVEESTARAVLVTGPAGLGKSRLMREFSRHIAEHSHDIAVWQSRGDPMRSGSPLDLLCEAIRGLTGVREGQPLADSHHMLAARVARSVPAQDADRVARFIGELIHTPWAEEDDVQLRAARRDSRLMGEQIRRACRDFLAAETHRHPVMIILEDLHWGDQATVSWIDSALHKLAEQPLLIVALSRPEIHDVFPALWSQHDVTEVPLRRLSAHNAKKLIHAALGRDLAASRVADLIERADGNPFYLEELIRSAAAGRWDLPDTVLAMVHARLQEVPATARRVLRAASIMGERLWSGSLVALCGAGVDTGVELEWLIESELLVAAKSCKFAGQIEYCFRHALIREAAYSMLTDTDRRLGHLLAAQWLQRVGEADALVVAEHFERAGELEEARPFLTRAALDACKSGDLEAALAISERGVASGATGETLGTLRAIQVKAYQWRGQHKESIDRAKDALSLLPGSGRQWYEVAEDMAASHSVCNDIDALKQWAVTMTPGLPPQHDQSGWLILASRLSWLMFIHGRAATGQLLLEQVDIAMKSVADVDPAVAARVHAARACRGWFVDSNPAALLRELRRAGARYQEVGDLHNACDQRGNAGFAEIELGLYREAEATLRRALATARDMKLDALVDVIRQNLSLALAYQNELDEARGLALASAESHQQRGDQRMAASGRMSLATISLLAGDFDQAEKQARAAVALSPGRSPVEVTSRAILARALLALERPAEALEQARRAIDLMKELGGSDGSEATIYLVWAEALHHHGDREKARAAISVARERLLERAKKIDDDAWRQSFLQQIPDHARTLELFQNW